MFAAYIFHNTFVFDNLISYILFFTFVAYIHTISTDDNQSTSIFRNTQLDNNLLSYVLTPIVLVVTAGVIYFVNIPAIQANRLLIRAINIQSIAEADKHLEMFRKVFDYNTFGNSEALEQLAMFTSQISNAQVSNELKQDYYNFTKEKIEEKVAQVPTDARYLVFAGSFNNRFGNYDEAIRYLERAIIESPQKQSIFFELGSSYIGKGDLKKMFEIFKRGYDLNPNALESKVIYALGAIYTKNSAVLEKLAPEIDQNIILNDDRFMNAYLSIGDYNSVIAILSARIDRDPSNIQNRLNLASVYMTIGRKQNAIDIIRKIMQDDPSFKDQGEAYIKQIQEAP